MNKDELKKAQEAEAIKRLQKLDVHENVIRDFRGNRKLNCSHYFNKVICGILYWLSDEEQQLVKEFEEKYNGMVYHIIKTPLQWGIAYSMLYVSSEIEEWESDNIDLEEGYPIAYVVCGDCKEIGSIGIENRNGGLNRTA